MTNKRKFDVVALVGALVTITAMLNIAVGVYMATVAFTATVKVEEVKVRLEETITESQAELKEIKADGKATHILVNSAMGAKLKEVAELTRTKADMSKDPVDETAARLAEQTLKEHQAKQNIVDKHGG